MKDRAPLVVAVVLLIVTAVQKIVALVNARPEQVDVRLVVAVVLLIVIAVLIIVVQELANPVKMVAPMVEAVALLIVIAVQGIAAVADAKLAVPQLVIHVRMIMSAVEGIVILAADVDMIPLDVRRDFLGHEEILMSLREVL